MLQVDEKRAQVIEAQTRCIARNIDEAIVANAFMIINVMGVTKGSENEEAVVGDILTQLNASMQGLSAVKAAFQVSRSLIDACLLGL